MKLTIDVKKYTRNGTHVCAENFKTGKVCEFYRTQRIGTHETCLFAPLDDHGYTEELKRVEGTGLVPGKFCIFNREVK